MMKFNYWAKWEYVTEQTQFTGTVTEEELIDKLNDPAIKVIEVVESINNDED